MCSKDTVDNDPCFLSKMKFRNNGKKCLDGIFSYSYHCKLAGPQKKPHLN